VVSLLQDSEATDVLVVQLTPTRDHYVPITSAAIDRTPRPDHGERRAERGIAALEWSQRDGASAAQALRIYRLAAEDEIEGLAQAQLRRSRTRFVTATAPRRLHLGRPLACADAERCGLCESRARKAPTAFWTAPSFADAAV